MENYNSRGRKTLRTTPLSSEEGEDFDGDVITLDPEDVTDESEPQTSSKTSGARSKAGPSWASQARRMFGTSQGAREKAEQAQRDEDTKREGFIQIDELDERDELRLLRLNSREAAERYMQSLRESEILVPGFSEDEQQTQLDGLRRVHVKMMMLGALRPLSQGVNGASVAQSLGAMTTMMILSPDFREEMGTYYAPLKDAVQQRIDDKIRSKAAIADQRVAQHNQLVDERTRTMVQSDPSKAEDAEFMAQRAGLRKDRSDYLSSTWQRRMDNLNRKERGHRDFYTAETAAMTEVGLMENAFHKMREPGHDAGKVLQSYRAMVKRLREQVAEEGIERTDVVKLSRVIVGQRMEAEPELQVMFNGMAHGRYERSAPHAERTVGSEKVRHVWSGEFHDQKGKKLPEDAMFTLRIPMSTDEHQAAISEIMSDQMLHSLEKRGMDGFNEAFAGYMVGYSVAEKNADDNPHDHIDANDLPDVIRARTNQTEVMMASMIADGHDEKERQRVYSNAYVDAIETVHKAYPDFKRDWEAQFGNSWQKTMFAAVNDPKGFYAQQQSAPRSWRTNSAGRTEERQPPGGTGYQAPQTDSAQDDYEAHVG